jgi:hypothetical protein
MLWLVILLCFSFKYSISYVIMLSRMEISGARGGAVVEALSYKPKGRRIDSRWYHWNFSLI